MKKVDYSSEAITRRLKQTDQLRVVSLALIKAKREHDEKKNAAERVESPRISILSDIDFHDPL